MMGNDRHFNSYGGGIHHSAVIGNAPEGREWRPGDPAYAPAINRTARVEALVTVDAGLTRPTVVHARAWVMKHVHVGHDCIVGEDVELAPGVVLGGFSIVMKGAHIGMNATVLPLTRIGPCARIGAGAVVTRDVPAGETWAGNPARELPEKQGKEMVNMQICPPCDDVERWLEDELANGALPVATVERLAREAGISRVSLLRAGAALGVGTETRLWLPPR
jgi:acetyltransferase-like isoleucine patch superfamily enzyme